MKAVAQVDKGAPEVIVGIGIPKAGSNKLDRLVSTAFAKKSCNDLWSSLPMGGTARDSIYCSHGQTISDKNVRHDVLERLGTECAYLGTHQDFSIASVLDERFNVSYTTMLRDPGADFRTVRGTRYAVVRLRQRKG